MGVNGFYNKHFKRILDIICCLLALLAFGWLYIIIGLLVAANIGKPILFAQERPGMIDPATGTERIFKLYKFRSMTNEVDSNGKLLPDAKRLTKFGRILRATSLA